MSRDVGKLLLDLISQDPTRRDRAGRVTFWDTTERVRAAVSRAVAAEAFPRGEFFRAAVEGVVAGQKRWVLAVLGPEHLPPPRDPAATSDPHHREAIAWCNSIEAAVRSEAPGEAAMEYAVLALRTVLPYAVDAALEAPEGVWVLLETRGCESSGAEVLENIGPRAAPAFLPELIHFLAGWGFERVNQPRMLSSVGRGDGRVIASALERLSAADVDADHDGNIWPWANVLAGMGPAAATAEALSLLHRFADSPRPLRRAIAASTLPPVAPQDPATADVMLRLLREPNDDAEDSVLSSAVSGCAHLPAFADRLAPRLVELLETFEEPNPDYSYGGRAARVCGVLMRLPGAAPLAVPTVRRMLRQIAAERNLFLATSLLALLESAGPDTAQALPELLALRDVTNDRALESGAVRKDVVKLIRKLQPRGSGKKARRRNRKK